MATRRIIATYFQSQSSLSHAGAADWILDDLEQAFVRKNATKRSKMVAIIGTFLANMEMGRRAA